MPGTIKNNKGVDELIKALEQNPKHIEVPLQYQSIQYQTEVTEDGLTPVKFLEYNQETSKLILQDPENYMPHFTRENRAFSTVLMGTSTNRWNQLQNLANGLPGGPYHMDGRDGKLKIHNSKANSPAKFSYTYAGGTGELLELSISTKYVTKTVEAAKNTSINPDDKSINTDIIQGLNDPETSFQDGRLKWHQRKLFPGPVIDNLRVVRYPLDRVRYNQARDPMVSTDQKRQNAYTGKQDAIRDIESNYIISKEDVDAYIATQQSKFNQLSNPQNESEMRTLMYQANNLDAYMIRKKVLIEETINPDSYGVHGASRYPRENLTQVYGNQAIAAKKQYWRAGYKHLLEDPSVEIIPNPTPHTDTRNLEINKQGYSVGTDVVTILREVEVEIPLPGARVLSSPYMVNTDTVMGNDVVKTTSAQVKANAKILGRPAIESSMNIEIKNISSRYSGEWYVKKARHTIDQGGYFVEVEFIPKVIPISTHTIKASVNTQQMFAKVNKVAEESLKTRTWNIPSEIKRKFEAWRKDNGSQNQSYLILQDSKNPTSFDVYQAKTDFSTQQVSPVPGAKPVTSITAIEPIEEDYED